MWHYDYLKGLMKCFTTSVFRVELLCVAWQGHRTECVGIICTMWCKNSECMQSPCYCWPIGMCKQSRPALESTKENLTNSSFVLGTIVIHFHCFAFTLNRMTRSSQMSTILHWRVSAFVDAIHLNSYIKHSWHCFSLFILT